MVRRWVELDKNMVRRYQRFSVELFRPFFDFFELLFAAILAEVLGLLEGRGRVIVATVGTGHVRAKKIPSWDGIRGLVLCRDGFGYCR